MYTRLLKTVPLYGSILFLAFALVGPLAYAKPPGGHLNVTEVFVDFSANELVIRGSKPKPAKIP